jgi:hypothetical protein
MEMVVVTRIPDRAVVPPEPAEQAEATSLLTTCVLFVMGGVSSLVVTGALVLPSFVSTHHCHGATRSAQAAKAERQACLRLGITPEEFRARQQAGEVGP